MRKIILVCCMAILSALSGRAQQIKDLIQYDTMVHVYKLNYEQCRFILKKKSIPDTAFLLTKKFREYPIQKFKNDTLPEGNFLIAKISDNTITYEYFYKTPLLIQSRVINNEVILFLSDKKTNKLVQNAKIDIEGLSVKYDPGTGGYTFPKKSIPKEKISQGEVFVRISYLGEIYIFQYSINEGKQPEKENDYFDNRSAILNSPGYLLLDKPMYKPLDSLNLKAFLIDFKTGKPIRRKASLIISEPQQRFYYTRQLKRKTPGAYLFNWKLPDTLKLDRQYAVELRYTRRGRTLSKKTKFILEEYELAKNKYTCDMPSEMFFAGDDITFYTTASDMNGFPVQGTRVHYQLRIDDILELFTDTLSISAMRKQNWYEHDTTIEYDKFIQTKIPSSILPPANAKYTLDVTLTDPVTFEKKVFSKHFLKYVQKEKLLFYQQEDSLHIRNLYNNRDTSKSFQLITFSGNDTLSKQKITTPFHYQLNPLQTAVMIMDNDSIKQTLNLRYHPLDITHVKGKRSGDSIMISFSYPFSEPVHYRIFKKEKLVKSGAANKLNYSIADRSLDDYRIMLTTNLQNKIASNFYELTFVPEKDILHFDKKFASTALPGDSLAVEIIARDFKNQPLKKINIAAYAVNAAFAENINPPFIDVPEKFQDNVSIKPVSSLDQVYLWAESVRSNVMIKNHHLDWFNLRKNEYYQLKYPKGGIGEIRFKKQQIKPEFAIAVTQHNKIYTPKYILLDGKPVYISDLEEYRFYSIAAESGSHQISFRFGDRFYTLPDVQFKPSTKLLLGVNIDSIKSTSANISFVDSLPILEPTEEEKRLLYSTLLITNLYQSDSLSILSDDINLQRHYDYMNGLTKLNIDGEYYFVEGPFAPHAVAKIKVNEKIFNLKTGPDQYYYYDDILKDFVPRKMEPIKGAFLHFAELETNVSSLMTLLKADTLLPEPQKAEMKYNAAAEKILQLKEEENLFQNYRSSDGNGQFRIIVQNKSDSNFVRSAWIVSKSHFEASDFIDQVYRPLFTFNKRNTAETYDIYLFFNRNRMRVLRDQHYQDNDELYINTAFVKPEPFSKEKIEIPLKVYSELNSSALLPFHDTPFEPAEKIKSLSNKKRNNIYLHGMITSQSQEPLQGAIIYAEINGKFRYGAVTNQNGLFEILDLIPGTYQIKIMHPEYKFSHFAPFLFDANTEYVINTSLLYKEASTPMFESVYNDFCLQAYGGSKQRNLLKLRVYDKESREQLKDLQVRLFQNDTLKHFYTIKDAIGEIPFPLQKEKSYTLEISKAGYTSLRIYDIAFGNNYLFLLNAFIGTEKKELVKVKEYRLEMEGALPVITNDEAKSVYSINADADYGVTINATQPMISEATISGSRVLSKESIKAAPTVATGDFAVLNGTYQRKSGDAGISIGGDRTSGTKYMIDGMQITRGNYYFSPTNNDQERYLPGGLAASYGNSGGSVVERQSREIYAEAGMIEQVIQNKNTSSVRKKFSDIGYWQPNLITDKQGRAAFTIKLPDNITAWKSYIAGVGTRWLHGTDSFETRVYKPLQTSVILPSFLYRDDQLFAKIRYTNLTRDPLEIVGSIAVNEEQKMSKKINIQNTWVDSILISTGSVDTIRFEGGLSLKERYKDFERYDVPVFSHAMKYFGNQSMLLEKDSIYQLNIEPNTRGQIILNNSLYEKIIAIVDELNRYEYNCVEQTTSKLYGLLLKARIQKSLQIKDKSNREINNMLSRLADMQNKNGSFGWWRNNGCNDRMTIYAMEISYMALRDGYINSIFDASKNYITQHFTSLNTSDQLYALHVLLSAGVSDATALKAFRKMTTDNLNTTDRIYFYQNKLKLKDTVSRQDLYSILLDINQKVQRPYYDNFFYDARADLFKAYALFSQTAYGQEFTRLFKKKLINGQLEKNLNTFSKARMIEALINETSDSNKTIQASVVINDSIRIKNFPYHIPITASLYSIKHSGGSVFLNTAEERWISSPIKRDSLFGVRTYFVQNKEKTESLKSGIACDFTVDIQAFRSGEQVMIEIPIPSGMKVTQKDTYFGQGNYVEYYKHKVVYFFDKLPMGKHQLVVHMMPVFSGEFMLPATKASLMYYPFAFGNNENRKISIH